MFLLAIPAAPAGLGPSHSPAAGALFSPLRRALRPALASLLLIVLALPPVAKAGTLPELRLASAYRGPYSVDLYSLAWYVRGPRWARAQAVELSAGVIRDASTSRPYAFAGPVWRLTPATRAPFIEFSFGPVAIAGATFDGRALGGNLHFRSALALGTTFGRRRPLRIALRVEHISNGGLRDDTPGLDSIGLCFAAGGR